MSVLNEVEAERKKQDDQWGTFHDDYHTIVDWWMLLREREGKIRRAIEVRDGVVDTAHLRRQLVIMAALAVAAVEAMDRQAIARTAMYHPTHSD